MEDSAAPRRTHTSDCTCWGNLGGDLKSSLDWQERNEFLWEGTELATVQRCELADVFGTLPGVGMGRSNQKQDLEEGGPFYPVRCGFYPRVPSGF
jgi:hypothetical protein